MFYHLTFKKERVRKKNFDLTHKRKKKKEMKDRGDQNELLKEKSKMKSMKTYTEANKLNVHGKFCWKGK